MQLTLVILRYVRIIHGMVVIAAYMYFYIHVHACIVIHVHSIINVVKYMYVDPKV